jgi:hypothetical protein
MEPSDVRERIRADHAALRPLLCAVGDLARRVEAGEGSRVVASLRECGVALLERFAAHLELEERILLPVLRAEGGVRAERLAREHHEQRLLLEYILGRLQDAARPSLVLGRELIGLVDVLMDDMADEEAGVLAERSVPRPT